MGTQCFKTFNFEDKLNQHISKEHEQKNCKSCPYCGKQFVWLNHHLKTCDKKWENSENSERPKFECPNCKKSYSTTGILRAHIKTAICLKKPSIYDNDTVPKSFESDPSLLATQKKLLAEIRKAHYKAKQFECTYCYKVFNFEKNLKNHISKECEQIPKNYHEELKQGSPIKMTIKPDVYSPSKNIPGIKSEFETSPKKSK